MKDYDVTKIQYCEIANLFDSDYLGFYSIFDLGKNVYKEANTKEYLLEHYVIKDYFSKYN